MGMVKSARFALPMSNCAIGETVCYFAKLNKNSSPNWRDVSLVVISDVTSSM